jgi:hypothetical protein
MQGEKLEVSTATIAGGSQERRSNRVIQDVTAFLSDLSLSHFLFFFHC